MIRLFAGRFWSMLLALCLATARALADGCVPPPSGIVGWWPGDGDANDIAGTNNGTLQGGAVANVAGMVGAAFDFNGTNAYVQIPDAPELKPTNLTVTAWAWFDSLDSQASGGSPAGQQYLVFKQNTRNGSFEGYFLGKVRVTGKDVFVFSVSSAGGLTAEVRSQTQVLTGAWYHVAGLRGPTNVQIYVNGQLEAQAPVSFPQDYGNFPLYFATSGQSYWDHKFKGSLDEVSLYNRPLTSNEISAEYLAMSQGKCKGALVISPPQSGYGYLGGSFTFNCTASGAPALVYQWRKNSNPIAGATNTFLTLTNLQSTNAGNYSVTVTNGYGTNTSPSAALQIRLADIGISLVPPGPGGLAQLSVTGVPGHSYTVQTTTNLGLLNLWANRTNLTLTNSTVTWTDPQPATGARRLYRLSQ